MSKNILMLSGSPKRNGNTALLVDWFAQGARACAAHVEIVETAFLNYKSFGCMACRACQNKESYECVIDDDVRPVLAKMISTDVIVMATPLYFFSASAQIKAIFDRMFSLYKWNNESGTFATPLKGKTFAVIASAFEKTGLDALLKPFELTAQYTSMKFESLAVSNAGVSGAIKNSPQIRQLAIEFGKKIGDVRSNAQGSNHRD